MSEQEYKHMTIRRAIHRLTSKVDTLSNVAIAVLMIGLSLMLLLVGLATRSFTLPTPLPVVVAMDDFSALFITPLADGVFKLSNEPGDTGLSVSSSQETDIVVSSFADPLSVDGQVIDDAWLSVPNVLLMYRGVADELIARFPEKTSQIETNVSIISTQLSKIDAKYRGRLSAHATVGIVFSDASVGYLARDYSLLLVDQIDPENTDTTTLTTLSSRNQILYLPTSLYQQYAYLAPQSGIGFYTNSASLASATSLTEVIEYNLSQLLTAFETQSNLIRTP